MSANKSQLPGGIMDENRYDFNTKMSIQSVNVVVVGTISLLLL